MATFTVTDYKKMKSQPSAFRAQGGSRAWRIASDACFGEKNEAIEEINKRLDAVEINEVKTLLNA
jgi:hypothetical protein